MYIAETHSTNTLLREKITKGEWPDGERFLRTGYQTAGRGQTGNGWESEADKNLLFSVLADTSHIPVENQFDLSVITSVALYRTVGSLSFSRRVTVGNEPGSEASEMAIKWPNDLYYGDRKLAGILIETGLQHGSIAWAIAGVGLNVNQTEFRSDAPNPVSLKQITGRDYDPEELMARFMNSLDEVQSWSRQEQWAFYRAHLYRREGFWPFAEREVTIAPTMNMLMEKDEDAETKGVFMARIKDILSSGEIVLQTREGNENKYHFKQIRYVL
jgi:BirA family biotin operon repressor/biotin-[acetyl-CoA-carboxylase] ligase